MPKPKPNLLYESIIGVFRSLPKARVLDLGCGNGDYSKGLKDLGFNVTAGDIDLERFRHKGEVKFEYCDITRKLPFKDSSFDYVLFAEVIEHLKNPYEVINEISRIISGKGCLILSTPNILSLKSRFRYLFEGSYDYFREPPLDQAKNEKEVIFNLHICPYRYQELEFLLAEGGFKISQVFTSLLEGYEYSFLLPLLKLQAWLKAKRSNKKRGIDYSRVNKVLLSKTMLFGRHLIVKAQKG